MSFPQHPQRILLIRLSHLGDVVHAMPIYHAVREAYPAARIAWAIQPEFAGLVENLEGLERVLVFDRRAGISGWRQLWRELRQFRPDWTIDAQGNAKSAAVTWLARARQRSGLHARDWSESMAAWTLNDPAPRLDVSAGRHAVDRSLHLASHVIGRSSAAGEHSRVPWLTLRASELEDGRRRFEQFFRGETREPVILQLSAPGDVRAWPVAHQREFLRGLCAADRPTLALSGPAEGELGARFAREFEGREPLRHWVGQRGLRELASFLQAAAQHGATFVGCDSGPMHMAAACGVPVLCLAGPQDARRTGPWPEEGPDSPHRVVRAEVPLYCAPCLARRCSRIEGNLCMQLIDPAAVLDRLLSPDYSKREMSLRTSR